MDETLCTDCGMELIRCDQPEWYMVEDVIWDEATVRFPAIYLCVGCLERRLKRELTAQDFAPVLGNFLSGHSDRLKDRMKGFEELKMEEAVRRIGGEEAVATYCNK